MRAHSESERSLWYVFLMHGRVSNYHYPTPTFRTVSLGNRVNKREGPRLLRPGPHAAAWVARALDGGDVLRLHPLVALRRLVGDLLVFFKRLESAATYPAVMHEEFFATLIRGDKAVALLVVEPLDRSLGHML